MDRDKLTEEFDDQDWRDLADASEEILSSLDTELQIYASEVDIESDGRVMIRLNTDEYDLTIDTYENFLDEVEDADKKYKGILRLIAKEFMDRGWMGGTDYDSFTKQLSTLSEKLTNFTISQDSDLGEEEIIFNEIKGRIRSIKSSTNGALVVLSDGPKGEAYIINR